MDLRSALSPPMSQLVLNNIVTFLPILRERTITLRSIEHGIEDGSVSEQILDSLELIEEFDQKLGIVIMESMKQAYRAVAVECTAKYLGLRLAWRDGPRKYVEAVDRIWKVKIENLGVVKKSKLVTADLMEWRKEIEAAVSDLSARNRLLERNTRNEAIKFVSDYLKEATSVLEHSIIELVTRKTPEVEVIDRNHGTLGLVVGDGESSDIAGIEDRPVGKGKGWLLNLIFQLKKECSLFGGSFGEVKRDKGVFDPVGSGALMGLEDIQELGIETIPKKKEIEKKNKHIDHDRHCKGPVSITEFEDPSFGETSSECDRLFTPKVNRAPESIKSSLVREPLLDTLHSTDASIAEMASQETLVEGQNRQGLAAAIPSSVTAEISDNGRNFNREHETVRAEEGNAGETVQDGERTAEKPVLAEERNTGNSSFNRECNDPIDASPEKTLNRFHTESLKRKSASPLNKSELPQSTRRRIMKKWSLEEEDALRKGVQELGKGNWKLILNSYPDIFLERTQVDLKDKWRNMVRY